MPSMQVEVVEERRTLATIKTAFVFQSSETDSNPISIELPSPNPGWTFNLSLKNVKKELSSTYRLAAFSFRRYEDATLWGNAHIHAQLSLVEEPSFTESDPQHDFAGKEHVTPLGAINVVLEDTSSVEVTLSHSRNISILQPNKVWLTVTISDCTHFDGFLQLRSSPVNEGEIEAHLARQSGDRHLSRSLTTGKLFDVQFLTPVTRSTSGKTSDLLPTYASLSVLEKHIDLSSSVLREDWSKAIDNTSTKTVREISCPDEYEYDLDSDFEDGDEVPPCNPGIGRNSAAREGHHSDTRRSTSLFSSFVLEEVSNQSVADYQLEDTIDVKCLESSLSDANYERTIGIKFAAHRTWRAFLWYCYTGNLEFSKLRSQVVPVAGGGHSHGTPLEGGPPACSPKSMYRLADLVGDKDLKFHALAAIGERMSEDNVLDEVFSVFTSKYPEVREVQLNVLKQQRQSPKVKQAFLRAMEEYSGTPRTKPVLAAVYDNLVALQPVQPVQPLQPVGAQYMRGKRKC